MIELLITVEQADLLALEERWLAASSELSRLVGEALRAEAGKAGGAVEPGLRTWKLSPGLTGQRRVYSTKFWAHFVERGTQPHDPEQSTILRWVAPGGEEVWAHRVKGTAPRPFLGRAISATEREAPGILERVLAGAGL
jgi:hypothetical protein